MAAFDLVQCLACGLHSTMDGTKAVPASQSNEGLTVADITPPEAAPAEVVDAEPESTPNPAPADAAPVEPDTEPGA
jgi:hypothetical protein